MSGDKKEENMSEIEKYSENEENLNFVCDFINNLYKDYLENKNILDNKQKELNEKIENVSEQINYISSKLECNQDLFNPNYNREADEKLFRDLSENLASLKQEKTYIDDTLKVVTKKIVDTEMVISKAKFLNFLNNFSEEKETEKFKIEILKIQELERKRIARELHDTTVQNLTALIHNSDLAIKIMDTDPIRSKLEIGTLSNSIREIIKDMRNIIYDLRPMAMDDIGVDIVIDSELEKYRQKGFMVNYEIIGTPQKLDTFLVITILRIIQEACTNTLKYANASRINVKFIYGKDNYEIFYSDDGIGFDVKKELEKKIYNRTGYGLSIIKERAYLLSAKLNIESEIGKGCRIHLVIPKISNDDN